MNLGRDRPMRISGAAYAPEAFPTPADYWYLASPYSKYPDGHEAAYDLACEASALLLKHRVPHYCPIVVCHPLVRHLPNLDPCDWTHWRAQNDALMHPAKGIVMLKGKNWENSDGMMGEFRYFAEQRRSVVYMDPGTVPAGLLTQAA